MRRVLASLKSPPKLTISQWADRHRVLSSESSAEPGRWRTARAAYQQEVMDAISDSAIETVVLMFSSQVGKTECLINAMGYYIDQDPSPMLAVLPTLKMAEDFSTDRLAPMLRDSPRLAHRVKPARTRDSGNTTLHKSFRGGHITMAGSNSPASLSSRPIRVLFCDEVDRYPASAGSEGDPVALATKRTATFWNRKIVLASSPTIEGTSRIAAAYALSDRRRRWVPCPHCDTMQTLKWSQVRWDPVRPQHASTFEDEHGKLVSVPEDVLGGASTAAYYCQECGAAWTDAQRWRAVNSDMAEWRAENPGGRVAGFHLSELYSPWRTIQQTVQDWLDAQGDTAKLQAFVNTALGEVWTDRGEAPDYERLIERREQMEPGVVPAEAVVLTAGVDNQSSPLRLEIYVWAWGPGYESWLVHQERIDGSPAERATWDGLQDVLDRDWKRADGGTMRIAKVGVDTGGNHTAAVYTQLRRLQDPRVLALKGVEGWNRSSPVMGPTYVDVNERGAKIKKGLKLWTVAVSTYKLDLYRRLWKGRGDGVGYPEGWVHLPDWLDGSLVRQLVAEQMVTHKTRAGFARNEWVKRGDNEALDCAVYARAALAVLGSDRYGDRFWQILRSAVERADDAPPAVMPSLPPPPMPGRPTLGSRPRSRRSSMMD